MSLRYTMSKDGVERCNVVLRLRLSRADIEDIKRLAKAEGESWREWLHSHASLGIEEGLIEVSGEYEQRYGKGDA
jgi:hypothetical protein